MTFLSKRNLLIVEDHDATRKALSDWLAASFPELEIHVAQQVEEALRIVEQNRIDIVIMDIGLPGINGLEGTREMMRRWPELEIVIISVHNGFANCAAALKSGAIRFIPKTKILTTLPALLEMLINRQPQIE